MVNGEWCLLDIHGFVPLGGLCSVITVFSLGAPVVGPASWLGSAVTADRLNLGAPVVGPALFISPLATNASPLDHARRAAGGE